MVEAVLPFPLYDLPACTGNNITFLYQYWSFSFPRQSDSIHTQYILLR